MGATPYNGAPMTAVPAIDPAQLRLSPDDGLDEIQIKTMRYGCLVRQCFPHELEISKQSVRQMALGADRTFVIVALPARLLTFTFD